MDAEGSLSEFREQRLENMAKLQEAGHAAFGQAFERTSDLGSLPALYEEGKTVRLAGRLVAKRVMGKSAFAHVQDATGKFQVYAKKDRIGEDSYAAFKILDLGDFVGAEGILFETRTGEQTVQITHWTLLSKALLPLPEKWHGLQDVETRYRQRYLDMVGNWFLACWRGKRSSSCRDVTTIMKDSQLEKWCSQFSCSNLWERIRLSLQTQLAD